MKPRSSPHMCCNEADVVARSEEDSSHYSEQAKQSHAFGESSLDRHASHAMTILF